MIFNNYSPPIGGYCEGFEAPGKPRETWKNLVESIDNMDPATFQKWAPHIARLRKEHGIAYNPYGDPDEPSHKWELDILPYLISLQDWRFIEKALQQRARALDYVLKDIYGEQNLIKSGILPPHLIYPNPSFLQSAHNLPLPREQFLFLYGVDMVRGENGRWYILEDHTQVPGGPGYSLENRIILSQVLSRPFHQNKVLRLAPFFQNIKNKLNELSYKIKENPTILLLSPGPQSENYFEHSFLARYMGIQMAESGDLTVRSNRLFLKTLQDLEPVDVLFRWIEDKNMDPLSLGGRADMGVPGLLEAARARNVTIINPIGAGIAQAPALGSYLNNVSQYIWGEALLTDHVESLWCGDLNSRNIFFKQPEQYYLRDAFQARGKQIIDMARISETDKNKIMEEINFMPYSFLAQKKMPISTIPTMKEGRLQPQKVVFRFYIFSSDDTFQVMPGGMAQVFDFSEDHIIQLTDKAITKDIWVMSDEPVQPISLMSRLEKPLEIKRSQDLTSRVADNLLWLGRYLERAENYARLHRSILKRLSGEVPYQEIPELSMLLNMADSFGLLQIEKMYKGKKLALFEIQKELLNSIYNQKQAFSLASVLDNIYRVSANARDRLSLESWRVLSGMKNGFDKPLQDEWMQISDSYDLLNDILIRLSAFSGLAMESMTRALGWHFLDLGRRIERAYHMILMLQNTFIKSEGNNTALLEALLEVADSLMTYRSRYRSSFQSAPTLDLLLSDEINPRSVGFQIAAMTNHLEALPRNAPRKYSDLEEQLSLKMLTSIRLANAHILCEGNSLGERNSLEALLDELTKMLLDFAQHISSHYLIRIPTTSHFAKV